VKSRVIMVSLVCILVVGLLLGACAAPAPAPKPSPTPAPTPAPAPQPVKLIFGSQNPETGWEVSKASIPWMKKITDASKGQITFQGYYAQSLFKGTDAWEAIKSGQADLGWIAMSFFPGIASLAEWTMLPGINYPSGYAAGDVMWQMYEKYPEMKKQFDDNIKVLAFPIIEPFFFQMKDKQIKTLDDIKGIKVRTVGGPQTDFLKALGASPVFMGINEVYENIDKGVIDGALLPWEANVSYRIYEIAKYYTIAPVSCGLFVIAMNKTKWNGLAPDVQKLIMDNSGKQASAWWSQVVSDDLAVFGKDNAKSKGKAYNEYVVPQDELDKWHSAAGKATWDKWIKDNEAKGFTNAKTILDDAVNTLKNYKK
jgi:TRAP-type C4-dicarboxylate transport system substrate-binding protein